jgi:hypothetical protein
MDFCLDFCWIFEKLRIIELFCPISSYQSCWIKNSVQKDVCDNWIKNRKISVQEKCILFSMRSKVFGAKKLCKLIFWTNSKKVCAKEQYKQIKSIWVKMPGLAFSFHQFFYFKNFYNSFDGSLPSSSEISD